MPGDKKTTTTKSETQPWAPAQPLLNDVLSKAQTLSGNTANFTPQFSDATRGAIDRIEGLANQPGSAQGFLTNAVGKYGQGFDTGVGSLIDTASGNMLGRNQYLDPVLTRSNQIVADQVNGQFSGAGRYGSGAHQGVLADRISANTNKALLDNYNTERQNMLNASNTLYGAGAQGAAAAGALDQANLLPAQLLAQAGAARDQISNAERTAPMSAVEWGAKIGTPIGGLGNQSSATQTVSTPANTLGMIGGGIMGGIGLATGNPMLALNGFGSAVGIQNAGAGMPTKGGFFGNGIGPWQTTVFPA